MDAKWLLNIGELIPRKNQETLIRAVTEIDGVYLTINVKKIKTFEKDVVVQAMIEIYEESV